MATTKVNSEFIAVNAISGTIIADGAITSTHLAVNSVDSSELVTGSIDTIHIAANQVTSAKIVSDAVLTRHIADDQVTQALIAVNSVGVSELNLSEGTDGQVLTTDGAGTLSFSTVSGTTINNNADNRIITGSGTANTLNGESGLTYDGSTLDVTGNITVGNNDTIFAENNIRFKSGGAAFIDHNTVGQDINFRVSNSSALDTTAITVDSSGNVLVGKTALDNSTVGIRMNSTGDASFVANGNRPLVLNRKTSDGDLAIFLKDSSTVGSIGTDSTDIYIGTTDTGIRFNDAVNGVLPYNTSSGQTDNTIDLGFSSVRWKDLYLSGGAYLGGTAAANKLDDYEEGTWTPALVTTGGVTTTSSTMYGIYTKIGNICHIHAKISATLSSLPGQTFTISGLPFTQKDTNTQFAIMTIGGHTTNLGGNAVGKAHFRTVGTQLVGVYLNSGTTAYWTYNTMDSSTFALNVHGHYHTT